MNIRYIAKRFLRRQIPDFWAFGLLELIGRSNTAEVAPDEGWAKVQDRLDAVGIDVAGKHVLEVGSGRFARLGLQMLRAGVERVTLVDHYALDLDDREQKSLLAEDCTRLGLEWEDVARRLRVLGGDFASMPVPALEARADVVLSSAVLEHTMDPQQVLAACWAWLKPGGWTSHGIDLRDHVFESPFEMLTFSEEVWQRWLCPKRGFHLNRWRLSDYAEAMTNVGFVEIGFEVLRQDKAGLTDIRPRLHERFKHMDPEMLSVQVVHLYGKKPFQKDANDPR